VEDHPAPLPELRRLIELKRAYDHLKDAEQLIVGGDVQRALEHYEKATAAAPDNLEFVFWHGVTLAAAGRVPEARAMLDRAYAANDGWAELLRRLVSVGLIPEDPELMRALLPA
jgi:tetratricopeptide (TPR) repeat protein